MFKKGDKVRRIQGCHEEMKVGDVAIVEGYDKYDDKFLRLCGYGTCHSADNFELVNSTKETISKWLKENAWYIAVKDKQEFLAAVKWLREHGEVPQISDTWVGGAEALRSSDIADHTYIRTDMECIDIEHKEVVLDFKTVVESVKLPEAPKKTEQQLKLEALEATINKAQQEIQKASAEVQALKEMK